MISSRWLPVVPEATKHLCKKRLKSHQNRQVRIVLRSTNRTMAVRIALGHIGVRIVLCQYESYLVWLVDVRIANKGCANLEVRIVLWSTNRTMLYESYLAWSFVVKKRGTNDKYESYEYDSYQGKFGVRIVHLYTIRTMEYDSYSLSRIRIFPQMNESGRDWRQIQEIKYYLLLLGF